MYVLSYGETLSAALGSEQSGDFPRERVLWESSLPCHTTALFLGARPTVRQLLVYLSTSFQLTGTYVGMNARELG